MKASDLIGFLFFFFFIVWPIIKALMKPAEPLLEVELPGDMETTSEDTPPEPQRPASEPAPSIAAAPPPQKQATATPKNAVAASSLRQAYVAAGRKASDAAPPVERAVARQLDGGDVIAGMIWHEILSEPVSRRRLYRGKRRKLLS